MHVDSPNRLQLPHTAGCLVCGRENPHGLRLSLYIDPNTGVASADFIPRPEHIGFVGIVHGGLIATVLDETMVWAAIWSGKRACLAGEMTVRFRRSAAVGRPLHVEAKVASARSRLIVTSGTAVDPDGELVVEAIGKYVPLSDERNRDLIRTFVDDPATADAARLLMAAAS